MNQKNSTSNMPVMVESVVYETRHALEEKADGEGGEDDREGEADNG